MLLLILYYLVLPLLCGLILVGVLKTYGRREIPPPIRELYRRHPMEPRTFRVARLEETTAVLVGDFESLDLAVDAAYKGRQASRAAGTRHVYLILDPTGATLEELES